MEHNNEELRNTNGCYLVTQFQSNPNRPFAQINVGITEDDWNAAISSGITISESRVVIKNAATSINLLTGEVGVKMRNTSTSP